MTEATSVTTSDSGLTPQEARHLGMLEKRIARGLQTFREVGAALLEIRDSRLYRGEFVTFEQYCSTKWGLERARAYQLMGAAEVVQALGEAGDVIVNEAQARELVPLVHSNPSSLGRVLEAAMASGMGLTAPALRKAAQVHGGMPPSAPPANHVAAKRAGRTEALVERIEAVGVGIAAWLRTEPAQDERDKVYDAIEGLRALLR